MIKRKSLLARAALLAAAFVLAAGPSYAQPTGGLDVAFGAQDAAGAPVNLKGHLWTPAKSPRAAVVLVHGSSGWSDFREGHYGRALSEAGYVVLAIDSFGPRRITRTSEDQSQISAWQMTRDAFAARRYLIEKGQNPERIAVMGFSKGGIVALYAADRNYFPNETARFQLSISFYPGCLMRARVPKPASAMFMALAEKDDYTGVKPCEVLADDFRKAGGNVSMKVYPGAAHGFDGNPAATVMTYGANTENYINCAIVLEESGRLTIDDKSYDPDDLGVYAHLRKTCVKRGASSWTNPRQKEAATRDVIEVLNSHFPTN